jgi:hypothetical protein
MPDALAPRLCALRQPLTGSSSSAGSLSKASWRRPRSLRRRRCGRCWAARCGKREIGLAQRHPVPATEPAHLPHLQNLATHTHLAPGRLRAAPDLWRWRQVIRMEAVLLVEAPADAGELAGKRRVLRHEVTTKTYYFHYHRCPRHGPAARGQPGLVRVAVNSCGATTCGRPAWATTGAVLRVLIPAMPPKRPASDSAEPSTPPIS